MSRRKPTCAFPAKSPTSAPPTASCCRARARCATACAACASPGLQEAVLRPRADQAAVGRVRRRADAVRLERGRRHARPGPVAGQGGALPAGRPAAGRRLALQGAADGLEPRAADARPIRCGTASPTTAISISCTATMPRRPMPAHIVGETDYGGAFACAVGARQYFRHPVPPGEKRRRRACSCTRISSTGSPDAMSLLLHPIHQP